MKANWDSADPKISRMGLKPSKKTQECTPCPASSVDRLEVGKGPLLPGTAGKTSPISALWGVTLPQQGTSAGPSLGLPLCWVGGGFILSEYSTRKHSPATVGKGWARKSSQWDPMGYEGLSLSLGEKSKEQVF